MLFNPPKEIFIERLICICIHFDFGQFKTNTKVIHFQKRITTLYYIWYYFFSLLTILAIHRAQLGSGSNLVRDPLPSSTLVTGTSIGAMFRSGFSLIDIVSVQESFFFFLFPLHYISRDNSI